ncbi:MAG TPA: hypothetical protein VI759_03965 [Dehalococcoidia bacterium]|nr:hypothetical protein [Dehalococcoidia bacterium]
MTLSGKIAANARYALGLRGFLRHSIDLEGARSLLQSHLARREASFLKVIERGVYAQRKSPYRWLLQRADIDFEDVERLVAQTGVEGTLERLYDAGVYVTLEESKGRQPLRRNGDELPVSAADFHNPLLATAFDKRSSGSSGIPTRARIDFGRVLLESSYVTVLQHVHGLEGRRFGLWEPGLTIFALVLAKMGNPPERVFTTADTRTLGLRTAIFMRYTQWVCGRLGQKLPPLEYVRREDVIQIARWLAEKTAAGTPAVMVCMTTPAVRICLAAKEHGLDISGTVFRIGGEPYTPSKAEVIASAGARTAGHYVLSEIGSVGAACGTPAHLDDYHAFKEKLGIIQREKRMASGASVPAMIYTTIVPVGHSLMLNTESGDYATMEERECGCDFGRLGYTTHLSGVGSYEKLTGEGVTFVGSRLYEVVEKLLPARFGGNVADYQIVEEEEQGLPKVSIVVAPRVGPVDEQALVATILESLAATHEDGGQAMTDIWRQSGTLRVVRREPYATATMKVLPLHVMRPDAAKKKNGGNAAK